MPDERTLSSGPCIDPEVLAAYVERRLTPSERADVDAHLAGCGDCYALLTEVMRTTDEMDAHPVQTDSVVREFDLEPLPVLRPRFGRRQVWLAAAGIAAAAVLAVRIQPWLIGDRPSADPLLEQLISAQGSERPIEARLTGGFRYAPYQAASRSAPNAPENYALLAAMGELQRRVQRDQSAVLLHAYGVANLLIGNFDDAIRHLEDAVAEAPRDARFQSDLSAAYLARAERTGRPEDWPHALAASEKAIAGDSSPIEARFNRALALDGLALAGQAREAWTDYLRYDNTSQWAEEARRRLTAKPVSELSEPQPANVLDAWTADSFLPRLADAILSRDLALRDQLIRDVGPYVTDRTARGDRFAFDVIEVFKSAPVDAQEHAARGIKELQRANALARQDRFTEAASAASTADASFVQAHSPLAIVATGFQLTSGYFHGRLREGERRLAELVALLEQRSYRTLHAQFLQRVATNRYARADYEGALAAHRIAIAQLNALGEQRLAIPSLLGSSESYRAIGDYASSWSVYLPALRTRHLAPTIITAHSTLTSGAVGCLNEGLPEVALHLALEARGEAVNRGVAGFLAESSYLVARSYAVLGSAREAAEYLAASEEALKKVEDPGLHKRIEAELRYSGALVFLASEPARSVAEADAAQQLFEQLSTRYRHVALALQASRALRRLGREDESVQRLAKGIDYVDTQRAGLSLDELRIPFLNEMWSLYGEMAAALIQREPERALTYVDRALQRRPPAADATVQWPPRMDNGSAMLVYALLGDRLWIWIATAHGSDLRHSDLDGDEARIAVRRLNRLLESRAERGVIDVAAAALSAMLLAPVEDLVERFDTLSIVPDPAFRGVPYALLPMAGGKVLAERAAVVLCPSVSLCGAQSVKPVSVTSVVALVSARGNGSIPALPYAQREADQVARLYPAGKVAIASPEEFRRSLGTADIVHYAGHALPDIERPWRSTLLLESADGKAVETAISQVVPPTIRSRVVVLAACATLAGREFRGQGVVGLAAEFLRAGAETVVATLWAIDDRRAATLFSIIHRELRRGQPAWQAVRAAQLAAIRDPDMTAADWASIVAVVNAPIGTN